MSKLQTAPSGWELTTLGTFMEFKNGVNADKNAYGSGTEFVNVMDIFKRNFMKKCNILGKVEITEKQKTDYSVKYGDILFNRTSEVPDEIAFSSVYLDEAEITFGGFVIRGRQKKELLDPLFAGYCFNNSSIRREMIRRSQGVVRANIGQKDLNKVPILIPPKDEQKKIASVLVLWDNAIEKTEALISLKSKIRESLANRLLFGKDRVSNRQAGHEYKQKKWFNVPYDWSITKIENIATEVVDRNSCGSNHTVLSCSKHVGFVESLNYFKKKVYSDNTDNYKTIRYGEFGYPSNHIEEGSIGLQNLCDIGIVSPIYTVFQVDGKQVSSDYLFKLLKTNIYRHIFQASTSSSVDRRGSLRWGEFSKIEIPLPSLDEQKDIAHVLNSFDKEIKILEQLLEKYRLQKRSLMQKLLTGEWQVSSMQPGAEGALQELTKESVA